MQQHYIIGTAGHIDHGKTTLTQALTGINTDRLKEEQQRSISIELGFAPFTLPNGQQASIIDVPGHEKFIRHMVAGVGGMDLILLVIAADEGIMPQTSEHLHIIQLLGISHGIVVFTKVDQVDNEFLDLVEEEVTDHLQGTLFEDAPICKVSAVTGYGMENLKLMIQEELAKVPQRSTSGYYFQPIDRVFSLKGVGTVVTGTVYSGQVSIGEELALMPQEQIVKVRQLQVHATSVNHAEAGQRVAVNITGVPLQDVKRGNTLTTPGQWIPTKRLDVKIHYLEELDFPIKHLQPVKFHMGTNEVMGRLILFDRKEVQPGETIYAQMVLDSPVVCSRGDRFILRRPTPAVTIGGGTIITPSASKHKHVPQTVKELQKLAEGTPETFIQQALSARFQVYTLAELSHQLNYSQDELKPYLDHLIAIREVLQITMDQKYYLMATKEMEAFLQALKNHLAAFHQKYPLRIGANKAEVIQQLVPHLHAKSAQALLTYAEQHAIIKTQHQAIRLQEFTPALPEKYLSSVTRLLQELQQQGLSPEHWDQLCQHFSIPASWQDEILMYLLNENELVLLSDKLVITQDCYRQATKKMLATFANRRSFTIQDVKEVFPLSRKYLVPLLEKWDEEKVTLQHADKSRSVHPSASTM